MTTALQRAQQTLETTSDEHGIRPSIEQAVEVLGLLTDYDITSDDDRDIIVKTAQTSRDALLDIEARRKTALAPIDLQRKRLQSVFVPVKTVWQDVMGACADLLQRYRDRQEALAAKVLSRVATTPVMDLVREPESMHVPEVKTGGTRQQITYTVEVEDKLQVLRGIVDGSVDPELVEIKMSAVKALAKRHTKQDPLVVSGLKITRQEYTVIMRSK